MQETQYAENIQLFKEQDSLFKSINFITVLLYYNLPGIQNFQLKNKTNEFIIGMLNECIIYNVCNCKLI